MRFTTRPEIRGSFGVVATTHWIASAVGMSVLERGGNAFDAAVAAGFVLQVVEPHMNGPGGDMPALLRRAGEDRVDVLCGQGPAPAMASIERFRGLGLAMIPGAGPLATVTPGSFDAWMVMLRDWGTWPLSEVLAPAIVYAEQGHPILPMAAGIIAGLADFFRAEWPGSAETWLPRDRAPAPHETLANPALAATWRRLVAESEGVRGREAGIEAARRAWSAGFVAAAIDRFMETEELDHGDGFRARGLLTGDDMAAWTATVETPESIAFGDWTVFKTGPWGQGPVLLQALAILRGLDLAGLDPEGPDFVHLVTETLKLAMADREAHYGDPRFGEVPLRTLLSEDYAAARRALIGPTASTELRPGRIPGFEAQAEAAVTRYGATGGPRSVAAGEPTNAHLARPRGDTVHLDIIDRWGNMVSATPSGGWLQSSPVIPALGFALNSRAQMFRLDPGLPDSLAPGKRPRTTLSPSMASLGGEPTLAFGTPGGDQQDQWQLILFLRHAVFGMGLQEAIDAPLFFTAHAPSSFHPREARPAHLMIESSAGDATLDALRRKGHDVEAAAPWTVGRLTATRRDRDGGLRAAATARLMQAYAIGR